MADGSTERVPSSHEVTDHSSGSEMVWYAGYGSNLSSRRFSRYLLGDEFHRGARDPSPPLADRRFLLKATLFFAGHSRMWGGGGIAYVDPDDRSGSPTLARTYLITWAQFEDIFAQENGTDYRLLPEARLLHDGQTVVLNGRYGRLISVGQSEGFPVVTFSYPGSIETVDFTAPSLPYLRTLAHGLRETYGLTVYEVAHYLASKPGISKTYSLYTLADLLSECR